MLSSVARVLMAVVGVAVVGCCGELVVYRGADQQTYFRVSVGGRAALESSGFASEGAAKNGLGEAVSHGVADGSYSVVQSGGSWTFTLRSPSNEPLAVAAETFGSRGMAETRAREVAGALREVLRSEQAVYVGVGTGTTSFVLQRSRDGRYHFHLRLADGQRTLFGSGFAGEGAARDAVVEVFAAGHAKDGFERKVNRAGQHYFRVSSPWTSRQLAVSPMYNTAGLREAAVDVVHAALRTLVERVVGRAAVVPPGTPGGSGACAEVERKLLEGAYEERDGQATARLLYVSESDRPLEAYVVALGSEPSSLPSTAQEFKTYARTSNPFGTVVSGTSALEWLTPDHLHDTVANQQGSAMAVQVVDVFRQATEVSLYRYPDNSGVVIDYYLVGRVAGCSKLYVATWVSIET